MECFRWPGPDHVTIGRRKVFVARIVWEWTNGPIPDGMALRPTCGRGRCVNPAHRALVTRGRPLTASVKASIRVQYAARTETVKATLAVLAAEYGVSVATVKRVVYDLDNRGYKRNSNGG